MHTLRLIRFCLSQLSAYALNKAGSDLCGGETRAYRVAAHLRLHEEAAEALRAHARARLLGR